LGWPAETLQDDPLDEDEIVCTACGTRIENAIDLTECPICGEELNAS